jgi:high-affinity iron transporter
MFAAALIGLREGLEAALIIGIVFSYLKKTGQNAHRRQAWIGVIAAIIVSVVVAAVIQILGAELEGTAEQIFEGTTMFLAVVILTWMIFWMRYQSRTMKSSLEQELQQALKAGQGKGLMAATFLAVFREGIEMALFLSAAAFASSQADSLVGALAGLGAAALIGYVIYASTARLNLRMFFNVTSVLLLFFAAGLLSLGVHEFQEAGILPLLNAHFYDTSAILSEDSTIGDLLHMIIGYNSSPSLVEVLAYVGYWVAALVGIRWFVDRKIARDQAVPVSVKASAQA